MVEMVHLEDRHPSKLNLRVGFVDYEGCSQDRRAKRLKPEFKHYGCDYLPVFRSNGGLLLKATLSLLGTPQFAPAESDWLFLLD